MNVELTENFCFFCEARPDLSGALSVFSKKTKKRERRADKGAQIV